MKPRTISSSCVGFDGHTIVQQSITTDDDDVTVLSRSRFVVTHLVGTVTVTWEGDAGWVDYARTKGESGSFAEDPDYDYGAKICAARISDLLLGYQNGDYTYADLHGLIAHFWPSGADVWVDPPSHAQNARRLGLVLIRRKNEPLSRKQLLLDDVPVSQHLRDFLLSTKEDA